MKNIRGKHFKVHSTAMSDDPQGFLLILFISLDKQLSIAHLKYSNKNKSLQAVRMGIGT